MTGYILLPEIIRFGSWWLIHEIGIARWPVLAPVASPRPPVFVDPSGRRMVGHSLPEYTPLRQLKVIPVL